MASPDALWRGAIPSATSGTWEWDVDARTLRADADFAALYGIDPVELAAGVAPKAFFSAIHAEDRPRVRIAVAGILAGAEVFSKEFRIVGPGGAIVWVHARGRGYVDGDDRTTRFTGILVDITDRKRAEERLRVAQTAGGVGTFEYMHGYSTVSVSDEFCRLLGFQPTSSLPLQTINSVVPGDQALIPGRRGSAGDGTLDNTFRITRQNDGSERWITCRGEIREGGTHLIGVIYDVTTAKQQEAALRDLNETLEQRIEEEVARRREAEASLRQAQKMEAIGQLTGGVAHDFNNLLMAISSSLVLIAKRLPDRPQVHGLIDHAREAVARGAALTQRMLAFARRQDLKVEPVDAAAMIRGMSDLMAHTIGPAWSLAFSLPDDLPMVVADANQLELAILNLVVNARDAMPDGGTIAISADLRAVARGEVAELASGSYLRISVRDSGSGMDAETLARATEPFFTTKGVGKGTGLGLSMIHGLARQLDGEFVLTSEVGVGTIASLWLPTTSAGPEVAVAAPGLAEPETTGRSLKIVVVDDDALILMNTAALLEDCGHRVLQAESAKQALALLAGERDIDLVITDHAMPRMTGIELARRIADQWPDLPIILATGYAEAPTGGAAGLVRLGKPFDQAQLVLAIAQALQAATPAVVAAR